jgi:hypothetical protein
VYLPQSNTVPKRLGLETLNSAVRTVESLGQRDAFSIASMRRVVETRAIALCKKRNVTRRYVSCAASTLRANHASVRTNVVAALVGIAILAIAASACGRVPDPGPASGSQTAAPTTSSQIDTATWKNYSSPKWGYALRYPAQWFELGTLGAPDTEEYLANERAGSPMSLSPTGVFVAISVHSSGSSSECSSHGLPSSPAAIDRMEPVSISGVSTNLYAIAGGEPYFQLNAFNANYCYMLSFVFRSASVRDSTEPIVQALIGSFRFGSPTAPAS